MASDDFDERAVLGDELQQRGDPLGELIGLQVALEQLPASVPVVRRRLIERKIAAHLDAHHDALYGALAPHVTRSSRPDLFDPALHVKAWRGGFADAIWVQVTRSGLTLVEILGALRTLPIARFIRRLELGLGDQPAAIAELVRAPIATLRELVVDETSRPLPMLGRARLTELAPIEPLLDQLELLQVLSSVNYRRFASSTLRTLTLWLPVHATFTPATTRFDADLPALEDLTASGFLFDVDVVARYPRLRRLALSGWYEPGWLAHLLRSPQLARLERLELGWRFTDDDLELLVRSADQLGHLTLCDVSANAFSRAARAAARARLPACVRL